MPVLFIEITKNSNKIYSKKSQLLLAILMQCLNFYDGISIDEILTISQITKQKSKQKLQVLLKLLQGLSLVTNIKHSKSSWP